MAGVALAVFWMAALITPNAVCEPTALSAQTPQESASPEPIEFTPAERDALLARIAGWGPEVRYQSAAEAVVKDYAGRPVVPCMIQVIQDEQQPARLRINAVWVLGQTGDARGIPVLRDIIDKPLKRDMSYNEWHLLHNALLCLGYLADDATLDLLFRMAQNEYWIERNPEGAMKGQGPEGFRHTARLAALTSIGHSGSQRAVDAFTTKQGIPEDLRGECGDSLLKAALRNQERKTKAQAPAGTQK